MALATNPKALEKLVKLLGAGREGYCPHLSTLPKGAKDPPLKGHTENPIGLAAALDHMADGGNIAIVGKDDDDLLMIDVDDPKLLTEPFPGTTSVRTRRRTGYHQYYRTTDPRLKNANGNVTKDGKKVGEFRGHNYYLVAPGSFVDTKPEEVPELFRSTAGQYTIECERAPAFVKLEDLPKPYRDEAIRQYGLVKTSKTEEPSPKTWTPPTASKYWTFLMSELLANLLHREVRDGDYFKSPIHGGDTPTGNCSLAKGLMMCWRCAVYLNPQHLLAVIAGVFGEPCDDVCKRIGTPHHADFISKLDKDGNIKAWEYGKKIGVFPADDPHPYPEKKRGRPKQELDRADFPKMTNENWADIKSLKPDELPEFLRTPQIEFKDGTIAMEIRDGGRPAFALYDGHEIQVVDRIMMAGKKIVDKFELADTIYLPVWDELYDDLLKGVQLPEKPEEYGSEKELFNEIEQYAMKYFDPVDTEGRDQLTVMILYIMRTGFQGHPAISFWEILNPRGQSEGGKGRKGSLVYLLGCRGIIQGHPTIGTIHRVAERWQPTLVIDEADIPDSTETADLVCFYNCRSVGSPFMRRAHSSDNIEISQVFGPTMLMTRRGFKDDGLESRCFPMVAKPSDKLGETIPYSEPPEMRSEAQKLRNKLLTFWLRRRRDYTIDPFGKEIKDRKKMTPRHVNACINSWYIAKLVDKTEILSRIAVDASLGLIEQRSTTLPGKIINVLYEEGMAGHLILSNNKNESLPGYRGLEILKGEGRDEAQLPLTFRQLIELCAAKGIVGKEDKPLSWTVMGRILNELEMKRWKERIGEKPERVIYVVPQRLAQLMQKFVVDRDEKGLGWLIGTF